MHNGTMAFLVRWVAPMSGSCGCISAMAKRVFKTSSEGLIKKRLHREERLGPQCAAASWWEDRKLGGGSKTVVPFRF